MAISTDPNDPHFGLESDVSSPNFGLPAKQEKSIAGNALSATGDVIKGFAQQFVPKLDLKTLAGLAYGPVNAQIQGYNALKGVIDTAGQVAEAEKTPPFSRERFGAGFNVAGQLGLLALGGIKKPTLREVALGEVPQEVTPTIPETPISDSVTQPIIPEERFPSLLRSDENLRRGELQQQANKDRGFTLVPEPPPEIAPAPTIEQTLQTAAVPEARMSPETGFTFPNEPVETRTNVPSETVAIGGDINAVQEPSTGEILQRQPQETGTTGGERAGVEQSVQGKEAPQTSSQEIAPTVPQPEPQTSDTGISNQRLTEAYGDNAPVATTGKGPGAWKDEGLSRLNNFQKTGSSADDPYSVLTNLREGKVPMSQVASDVSLLRSEHQRLLEDARKSEGTPEYAVKSQAALGMATAIKGVAHGPASDVFRALQEYDKPRYDNVTDFDQALREREGRESTPQEQVRFKKISDDVTNTRNGAEKEINGVQKQISRFPKMSFEDAYKSIHDQITELTKDCIL